MEITQKESLLAKEQEAARERGDTAERRQKETVSDWKSLGAGYRARRATPTGAKPLSEEMTVHGKPYKAEPLPKVRFGEEPDVVSDQELLEENREEFALDLREEADRLQELADEHGINLVDHDIDLTDAFKGSPQGAIDVEMAKELLQNMGLWEERRSERKARVAREKQGRVLRLSETGVTGTVDVSVDLSRLESTAKRGKLLRENGEKHVRKMWGYEDNVVIVYPKSENRPARLRLINPETNEDMEMSLSEWEAMFSDRNVQVRFPRTFQTDEARANWLLALKAVVVDKQKFGATGERIYFSSEVREHPEVNELVTVANKARKAEKKKNRPVSA